MSHWYDFMNAKLTCPKCKWVGRGSWTVMGESFDDGSERHCPVCDHCFGFRVYPLLRESLEDPRAPEEDRMFAEVVMQALRRDEPSVGPTQPSA